MNTRTGMLKGAPTAAVVLISAIGTSAIAAQPGVSQQGAITVYTAPSGQSLAGARIDFVNARPMPLPRVAGPSSQAAQAKLIQALQSPSTRGKPAFSSGGLGDGKESPVFLGSPVSPELADEGVTPQEFGTLNHPFTTVRADAFQGSTNKQFPFRASGKLFFNIGADTFVCSASLIKRGIVVTAAHCIADFGASTFYSNWVFVPGYKNGAAPYGTWPTGSAVVLTSYFNGTDSCAVPGVVCQNDVGVLRLNPQAGRFPGQSTGFYGFGVGGFGFTPGNLAHITQIGYPVCLDNGQRMERNDSYGFVSPADSNNTVIGSLMCGGSSGGPWLVNFGKRPTLTGTTSGSESTPNTVVGVASWGYVSTAPKEMGASPFTSGNIGILATFFCGGSPNPC